MESRQEPQARLKPSEVSLKTRRKLIPIRQLQD